jgi:hypothetical protein
MSIRTHPVVTVPKGRQFLLVQGSHGSKRNQNRDSETRASTTESQSGQPKPERSPLPGAQASASPYPSCSSRRPVAACASRRYAARASEQLPADSSHHCDICSRLAVP